MMAGFDTQSTRSTNSISDDRRRPNGKSPSPSTAIGRPDGTSLRSLCDTAPHMTAVGTQHSMKSLTINGSSSVDEILAPPQFMNKNQLLIVVYIGSERGKLAPIETRHLPCHYREPQSFVHEVPTFPTRSPQMFEV